MVRVGLFGALDRGDLGDAVTAAVVRSGLAQRLPGLDLRTYTPSGAPVASGLAEPIVWSDQPLGAFGPIRQEELAATLDAVVIAGSVALDPAPDAPERLLIEGLGAFEPDVPVVWFGVTPDGETSAIGADLAREGLARRVGVWTCGVGARERLEALGADAARIQTVPHPALALPRLAPAADMPQVVERLRAAASLPDGDAVVVDAEGAVVEVPRAVPLPSGDDDAVLRAAAAIAAASVVVSASEAGCAIAAAYGRPVVWAGAAERIPAFAIAMHDGEDLAAAVERARGVPPDPDDVAAQTAEIDRALDAVAELLRDAQPAEGSAQRALRIRLREEEAAAASRERDLVAYNDELNTEIVAKGPRFTALWRKIHTGDRHYHWHKLRADRADAEIAALREEAAWLRRLLERTVSYKVKRAVRSTKIGDAAARKLGRGPGEAPPPTPISPVDPDDPDIGDGSFA